MNDEITTSANLQQALVGHDPVCHRATMLGILAIISWSPAELFFVWLRHLPVMLVLAVSFSVYFIVVVVKLTVTKSWGKLRQPPLLWLYGFLGIYINNLCNLYAIQYAPVAPVVLLAYMWPITILFLARIFLKQRLTLLQIVASGIALLGLTILVSGDEALLDSFNIDYLWGYFLAFMSGTLWAIYCIACQYYRRQQTDEIGIYCGLGAITSFILYFCMEQDIAVQLASVSYPELAYMLALGLSAFGFAFTFWDYGLKQGNVKLLYTASFFIPVLSTAMLVLFREVEFSMSLLAAVVCVSFACYLAKSKQGA